MQKMLLLAPSVIPLKCAAGMRYSEVSTRNSPIFFCIISSDLYAICIWFVPFLAIKLIILCQINQKQGVNNCNDLCYLSKAFWTSRLRSSLSELNILIAFIGQSWVWSLGSFDKHIAKCKYITVFISLHFIEPVLVVFLELFNENLLENVQLKQLLRQQISSHQTNNDHWGSNEQEIVSLRIDSNRSGISNWIFIFEAFHFSLSPLLKHSLSSC